MPPSRHYSLWSLQLMTSRDNSTPDPSGNLITGSYSSASYDTKREDAKLTVKIENKRPVELTDLTESLLSLGDEYKRFVAAHPDLSGTQNVRLYIKEIR